MSDDYFTEPGTNVPISVREMLRRTFWIYVTNIRTILMVAIIVFVPAQIIIGLAARKLLIRLDYIIRNDADNASQAKDILSLTPYILVLQIVAFLVYSVAEAAIVEITKNAHVGTVSTTFPKAMAAAKSCILQVFLAVTLISLASYFGFCLLILPGIYVALGLWVTCPVVVVEGKGVYGSLSRSWNLSSGYRRDLFWIYCAYVISFYVILFAVNLVMALLLWPRVLRYVLGYCVPVASFQPLGYILQTVVYFDLRARKESLTRAILVTETRMMGGGDCGGDGARFSPVNGPVVIPDTDEESSGGATGNPAWTTQTKALQTPDWTAQSEQDDTPPVGGGGGLWDNNKDTAKEKYRHFEIS